MVKLTAEIILRGTSSHTKKKREEAIEHYLKRITHLYLEDKGLHDVGDDLSSCRNLTVLYLYDNKLTHIPNLISNGHLTHLYLQNNCITDLDGLEGLEKLQKLYLGGNAITVVEGLEGLASLQELYVENQHLPPGEKLIFEPRALECISASLTVLNISKNNLYSLADLSILKNLQQLYASDNKLVDFKDLAQVLPRLTALWRLDLMGNPLCHKAKYRDRIILVSTSLEILDGKEVTNLARQFILSWQASKDAIRQRSLESREKEGPAMLENAKTEGEAPRAAPSVPGYIMPAMPKRSYFDNNAHRTLSQPTSAYGGKNPVSDPDLRPRSFSIKPSQRQVKSQTTVSHLRARRRASTPVMDITEFIQRPSNTEQHVPKEIFTTSFVPF